MSSIDELPPDQRAALLLLLRQRKSHDEVAGLLGIPPRAVHDRAHAALAVLAPAQARRLDAAQREEIGEYLLGQQADAPSRLRTRTLLSSSDAAGSWARALAGQLDGLAPGAMPEIPSADGAAGSGEGSSADGAGTSRRAAPGEPLPLSGSAPGPGEPVHARPSSRIGGALLLAAIVAAVVVVVIVVSKGDSSPKKAASTTTGTNASKASSQPKAEGRVTLSPPSPASNSKGTVEILSEGGKKAFFIQAEHIPSTSGSTFYAVWLYNSPSSALPLSKSPPVGASQKLAGAALLPNNAASYKEILLTRETTTRPTKPGPIVLRGRLHL